MQRLIFDIETDGFLDVLTRIHCVAIKDADTGDTRAYRPHEINDAVARLEEADVIIGHNACKFDVAAIKKLYPSFAPKKVRDTMVMARLIWPEIKQRDLKNTTKGYPGKLVGKHTLAAWGHRLGNHKGDYEGGWETFNEDMLKYNLQDVEVTASLFDIIEKQRYSEEAIQLEHDVQEIIDRQEKFGFRFNEGKAIALWGQLVERRTLLEAELKLAFPPWEVQTTIVPKVNNKTRGYVKGVPFIKCKTVEFQPTSRDCIAGRLITLYGWKPEKFTDGGKPQVDEKTIAPLTFPCAPLLLEYLLVDKRIGQLAVGPQAWLKHVKNGRIHGAVNPMGTVTGRMSHFFPNVAQVPKVGSPYGAECRELFEADPGYVLVGADAAGLELRCLAHFLARFDDGAYARAVVEGKQEDQSDVHSLTARAIGLEPHALYTFSGKTGKGRDFAKTFIYAFLYGAGDAKLGSIVGKGIGAGRSLKKSFITKIPGMKRLRDAVKKACSKGWITGLDGRKLNIRSEHAALNTLLQSAGAVVMKAALVILDADLSAAGYIHSVDYAFVANIHDEFQIQTTKENADAIGRHAVAAIHAAGERFKFRCPLDGAYKIGANWRETH